MTLSPAGARNRVWGPGVLCQGSFLLGTPIILTASCPPTGVSWADMKCISSLQCGAAGAVGGLRGSRVSPLDS